MLTILPYSPRATDQPAVAGAGQVGEIESALAAERPDRLRL
jgi:hypothetical protein